jgi:hypothetical protein
MSSLRSFVSVPFALLLATTISGCGNDKPKPDPSAAPSASGTGSAKGRLNLRTPLAPTVKVDPQSTKDYRVEVCYFGTMTLRQARDAYLASLGGAEPSEKKIPNFGGAPAPGAAAPGTSAAPGASGAPSAKPGAPTAPGTAAKPATAPSAPPATAKPAVSGAPSAKPAVSGTPAAGVGTTVAMPTEPPGRRPFDVALRAPHERNARACSVAAGLKDAAMGDVDTALQAYAPFAGELAKNIATATTYYQREEFKKDSFAKGKELHKQLVEGFQKLDDLSDKLGAAIEAWRKAHPADAAKMDEGEKLGTAAYADARDVLLALAPKKPNVQGFKDATGRLEKSIEALKKYSQTNAADPWGKMMSSQLESMLRAAKDADGKVTEKGVDGDTLLVLTNSFVSVIEARYRALSRSLTMKAAPAQPATAPAPTPAAPEAPKPE